MCPSCAVCLNCACPKLFLTAPFLVGRYLLCEVIVPDRRHLLLLDDRAVAASVREAVARVHGDYGAALCSSRFSGYRSINWAPTVLSLSSVKYLNAHTGIVFLRFPKRCYKLLWSALPFITSIEARGQSIACFLNCLHVGGTIRTCQKFLIRYNTQQLHRMLPKCKNEEEKQQVKKSILKCTLTKGNRKGLDFPSDDDED
uniref:Ribonuclease P/MRP protein subunit POP5 n=1 Tax=Gasterosteus aculeatus aculeatus TaxID=481459 RepID=G3PGR8_GASAC